MNASTARLSRRALMAALGATAFAVRPSLAAEASPVAIGALADNKLAQAFETAPSELPDVAITGPSGDRPIADIIKGRTVLMPLWAEWCTPCLIELSDFARLQEVYGNDKFAIIPILTYTQRKFTPDILGKMLASLNASTFEPLMESNFGRTLAAKMAAVGRNAELPCNLLISPSGRVIGRELSLQRTDESAAASETNEDRLKQSLSGQTQSLWGTPAGDGFATCLAGGFVKFP